MAKETKDAKGSAKDAADVLKGQKAHLVLLLDESGSMSGNREAVVTGVNEFLSAFRKQEGKIRAWISHFDYHPGEPRVRPIVAGKKIGKVDDYNIDKYRPRGTTPLNDAILETIDTVEKSLGGPDERVFMVILTDGYENASEAKAEDVKKVIAKYEAGDQWTFLYLGANQNAQVNAQAIGLATPGTAMNFRSSKKGTESAIAYATADMTSGYLSGSKHAHEVMRSAAFAQTGGKIEEEDEKPDAFS